MRNTLTNTISTQIPTDGLNMLLLCQENPVKANYIINNIRKISAQDLRMTVKIPDILPTISILSTQYLDRLVTISGSIIKLYPVTYRKVCGEMECLKCNDKSYLEGMELDIKKTHLCQSCGSECIRIKEIFTEAIPSQRIRIQDIAHFSAISETVEVLLENDLAEKYKPGDKINVLGIVDRKWKVLKKNEEIVTTLFIRAVDATKSEDVGIELSAEDRMISEYREMNTFDKRKYLLKHASEDVFGLEHLKLGILIALAGKQEESSKTRKTSHILIVGDPGVGKTRLLRWACNQIEPSVYINGVNTSDAGLTSCAVKQGKEWALEAGALVIADNGICCIDQFNKLRISDKGGLLEAMEQQTLSIAKAGIVTTLSTRCSIIAAATSRYNYKLYKPVSENLAISTPLVSRFDLIFGVFDTLNPEKDEKNIEQFFKRYHRQRKNLKEKKNTLKTFIGYCQEGANQIDKNLSRILLKYYAEKREIEGPNEFNTVRMLESLIRLAESHANLLLKESMDEEDVYIAIILQELSLNNQNQLTIEYSKVFVEENYFNMVKEALNSKYHLNKI